MIIDTKYNIGDVITWQQPIALPEMENCSFCNGSGQIQGHDGRIATCPICNGTKKEHKKRFQTYSGAIESISGQFNTLDNTFRIIFKVIDNETGASITVNSTDLPES